MQTSNYIIPLVLAIVRLSFSFKHTATINVADSVTLNDELIAFEDLPVPTRDRLAEFNTTTDPALVPLTNDASIHKLVDDLFVISYRNNIPKYRYILVIDTQLLQCDLIWPGTSEKFWCASDVIGDDDTQINIGETSTDGDDLSVTGDTQSNSPGGSFPDSFKALLEDHLSRTAHEEQLIREISASNDARAQEMYSVMSLIFFFVFVICISVINLTTAYIYYYFGTYKYAHYAIIWTCFCVMTIILNFGSSIFSMFIWLGIMLLIVGICAVIYVCRGKCAQKARSDIEMDSVDSDPDNDGTAGGGHFTSGTCLRMGVNYFPAELSTDQKIFACSNILGFILAIVFMVLTAFPFWTVNDYTLVDRETSSQIIELTTTGTAKNTAFLYGVPGAATTLNQQVIFPGMTRTCGIVNNIKLENLDEKRVAIYQKFIEPFDMDVSQFDPSDYTQYETVNEFFTRKLAIPRPIAEDWDALAVSSAADCRVMVFPNVEEDRMVWIKGKEFSMRTVVGPDFDDAFKGGSMILFRLALQDYHRFHSPVAGTIGAPSKIAGTLHSVNMDGMPSCNKAIENQRETAIIETEHGKVAYVMIGALCVGSIVVTAEEGTQLERGDEIGFFQYGGSTIAVFFEKGMIEIDPDLRSRASRGVETYVRQGQRVARFLE